MKKTLPFILLLLALQLGLKAQKKCFSTEHNHALQNDPQFQKQLADAHAFAEYYKATHSNKVVQNGAATEIHIPVVFHVAHTGGAVGSIYNPSDADLMAVINSLNLSYSNTFNEPSTPGTFNSVNTPIRFDLAQRTPTCVATTGIERVSYASNTTYVASGVFADVAGIDDTVIKNALRWPVNEYYNIYVVNKIDGADGTSGGYIAGYATLPQVYVNPNDGMVILATQCNALSTTPTHEIGHALSLRHPFGNVSGPGTCPGSTGDCTVDNDGICDTPPVQYSFACNPTGNNPCTGAPWTGEQYNYMAYFGCTDRFTAEQSTAMQTAMDNLRSGLKTSLGTDPPPASSVISATCNPTIVNSSNNFGMGPRSVELAGLTYNSNAYEPGKVVDDITCTHEAELYLNNLTNNPINVITNDINSQRVKVYIDFNNNGTFDVPAELITLPSGTGSGSFFTHTGNVVLPSTVVLNTPIRMRVIADFNSGAAANPTPCGALLYGQAEDYRLIVRNSPLAVKWKYINANAENNSIINVNWATAQEVDANNFIIERSTDGINFQYLATKDANGNTSANSYYYFKDLNPINGVNYYRIKQIDNNGVVSYSAIASAKIISNNSNKLSIAPNPTSGLLQFSTASNSIGLNYKLQLVDMSGRTVLSNNGVLTSNNKISIAGVAKGLYLCYVNYGDEQQVQRVIIE